MQNKNIWNISDNEKRIISSIVTKGLVEEKRNNKFAIIDFDIFNNLYIEEEKGVIKKYLLIEPKEISYKPQFLGIHEPVDLISIANQTITSQGKSITLPTQYLPKITYDAYLDMNKAVKKDINKHLLVEFGYRSLARQIFIFFYMLKNVYNYNFNETIKRVCFPEYSEHVCPQRQAIDFITTDRIDDDFDTTQEYQWLREYAKEFGFFESYPKNNKEGMMYEPWHWHHKVETYKF